MLCHYAQCHDAQCFIFIFILLVVIMLSVVMLSVVMLSVVMLSVVVPTQHTEFPISVFCLKSFKNIKYSFPPPSLPPTVHVIKCHFSHLNVLHFVTSSS